MVEPGDDVFSENRRTFLKQGVSGTLLMGFSKNFLAGCAPAAHLSKKFESVKRFVLDPGELAILESLAEAFIPVINEGEPTVQELGVASAIDELLSWRDVAIQDEFKQLLMIFESGFMSLFFNGIPRAFTNCTTEQKLEVLESWSTSMLPLRRKGYMAVKRLCMVSYWTHERAWKHCGYGDGPMGYLKYQTIKPGQSTSDEAVPKASEPPIDTQLKAGE